MRPKFITFEGGEGSGKTTQSKLLYEYLISKGIKAIYTREPGGTLIGEKIRDIVVNSKMHPLTELLLIMGARYEHICNVIKPALQDNHWVICDRFIDSTICYQCWNMGINIKEFIKFSSYYSIMPNITFFMDLKPEICFSRIKNKSEINKFDNRDLKFHKDIYDKFKVLVHEFSRIKTIECGNLSVEEIHHKIINHPELLVINYRQDIDNIITDYKKACKLIEEASSEELNQCNEDGDTLLHSVAYYGGINYFKGNYKICELLISKMSPEAINKVNEYERSALDQAVWYYNERAAIRLIPKMTKENLIKGLETATNSGCVEIENILKMILNKI